MPCQAFKQWHQFAPAGSAESLGFVMRNPINLEACRGGNTCMMEWPWDFYDSLVRNAFQIPVCRFACTYSGKFSIGEHLEVVHSWWSVFKEVVDSRWSVFSLQGHFVLAFLASLVNVLYCISFTRLLPTSDLLTSCPLPLLGRESPSSSLWWCPGLCNHHQWLPQYPLKVCSFSASILTSFRNCICRKFCWDFVFDFGPHMLWTK